MVHPTQYTTLCTFRTMASTSSIRRLNSSACRLFGGFPQATNTSSTSTTARAIAPMFPGPTADATLNAARSFGFCALVCVQIHNGDGPHIIFPGPFLQIARRRVITRRVCSARIQHDDKHFRPDFADRNPQQVPIVAIQFAITFHVVILLDFSESRLSVAPQNRNPPSGHFALAQFRVLAIDDFFPPFHRIRLRCVVL